MVKRAKRTTDYIRVPEKLIPILDEMLMELTENRLEVCLIPSKKPETAADGGMIRAVCSKNPDWYRDLCLRYPCNRSKKRNVRKDHTRIKRACILGLLERMIKNRKTRSMYAEDLLEVAEQRYQMYSELEAQEFEPWDNQF